ncbi:MAG: hypothetical protein ACJ746_15880 [Bryobacteraceae bacterium]
MPAQCSPPLAQERAAVLDAYFDKITVEQVNTGKAHAIDANLSSENSTNYARKVKQPERIENIGRI